MEQGAENLKAELISENNQLGHIVGGYHWATDIRINNYDGNQVVPYAASYTPDPTLGRKILLGPLAGNLTITNPLPATYATGQELEIAIIQDSSPSTNYSVSWGSAFRLGDFTATSGPNDLNVYTFRRHEAAWILVSAMANVDGAGLV